MSMSMRKKRKWMSIWCESEYLYERRRIVARSLRSFFYVPRHYLEMSRSRRKENHDDNAHFSFVKKLTPVKKTWCFFSFCKYMKSTFYIVTWQKIEPRLNKSIKYIMKGNNCLHWFNWWFFIRLEKK